MKQTQHLRLVGDVRKTFGTYGELIVKQREEIPRTVLQNKESVFIYIDGLPVPFYMKLVEPKGAGKLVVVFEDMETETLAAELVGKQVYIASREETGSQLGNGEFDALLGFAAIDVEHGELGLVKEVLDIPGNPCLVVIGKQGQEIIIPLNEDLVSRVDSSKKQIYLNVPDGLLNLYS